MSVLPNLSTFFLIVISLFVAVLGSLLTGWSVRRRRNPADVDAGLSALNGSVFGLMGLLIAFTFTGAASRFDVRRSLILQETNAISAAWKRVDLLPAATQSQIRQDLRDYLDERIETSLLLGTDAAAAERRYAESIALQTKIWKEAVAATQQQSSAAVTSLVLTSLTEMINITTTRYVAFMTHPPLAIYEVLVILLLASSLLAGYGMGKSEERNWTHMLIYSGCLAIAMYVILDLDYPRLGLIRIDYMDQLLVNLRHTMG
jgi:hypothetical protein